jgi:hypothetical protein
MLKKCIELLDADHDLFEEYNSISDGKWDLMLRQPHYGYGDTGAEPSRNMIDGLCYVQTREDSNPSVGHMGIAVEGIEGINPGISSRDKGVFLGGSTTVQVDQAFSISRASEPPRRRHQGHHHY